MTGPHEIYEPRPVALADIWQAGETRFKIYSLLAKGKDISPEMAATARHFLHADVLPRIRKMGDDNGLGFTIIHPGEFGLSISAHWWVQGSVLCQHFYRKQYADEKPLDTTTRPVIGCVWELAIIHAEQIFWQKHMMKPDPDPAAYLQSRADAAT